MSRTLRILTHTHTRARACSHACTRARTRTHTHWQRYMHVLIAYISVEFQKSWYIQTSRCPYSPHTYTSLHSIHRHTLTVHISLLSTGLFQIYPHSLMYLTQHGTWVLVPRVPRILRTIVVLEKRIVVQFLVHVHALNMFHTHTQHTHTHTHTHTRLQI